jgi:rod shape-determining protein MreC
VQSKQVRRRRAVVAALVVASVILLTAYFGESANSPLHSVQRGIVAVFSPVEQGASTVLSPFRDVASFFSNTFKAKSQVKQLQSEVARLRAQLVRAQYAASQTAQLQKEVGLQNAGLSAYKPVAANVIFRDPSLWYATIQVDKGSGDGVRKGDPVTGDGALVGEVTQVGPNFSVVSLLTDPATAVAAQVQDSNSDAGVLVPAVGNPSQLVLQDLQPNAPVQPGQQVSTVGFKAGPLQDLFPAAIPIGTVAQVGNQLANDGQVTVTPDANLRQLTSVHILTAPHAGNVRASTTAP